MEVERTSVDEDNRSVYIDFIKLKNRLNKKKERKSLHVPKFGCFKSDDSHPVAEKPDVDGSFDIESVRKGNDRPPSHLVITVNGIIGSAENWRFAAKQLLDKFPEDVIVHCSECNSSMLTFDGVDIMGARLADEVTSVVKRHPDLEKISFISHSLGGLVARYAIAKLYRKEFIKKDGDKTEELKGKIAGLEPVNFITSATPHLGSRGHKQVPAFCGFWVLEKVAFRASWCLGRTGSHLFLADDDNGKPPLLLQMADDCEDLPFISALQCFKRRVAYANARYDHLVGWSTSSLRRQNELPKRQRFSKNDKYPHIINVEAGNEGDISLQGRVNWNNSDDDIEETMIRGLTRVRWERVDVSFSGSKQRYLAHSTIQVKTYFLHSDGADVIHHMVDNFLL
jgi:hypothetical protein